MNNSTEFNNHNNLNTQKEALQYHTNMANSLAEGSYESLPLQIKKIYTHQRHLAGNAAMERFKCYPSRSKHPGARKAALNIFKTALRLGNAEAIHILDKAYQTNATSTAPYQLSTDESDPQILYDNGLAAILGCGEEKNLQKGMTLFQKSQNNDSIIELGIWEYHKGNNHEAKKLLEKAPKDNARAQAYLALTSSDSDQITHAAKLLLAVIMSSGQLPEIPQLLPVIVSPQNGLTLEERASALYLLIAQSNAPAALAYADLLKKCIAEHTPLHSFVGLFNPEGNTEPSMKDYQRFLRIAYFINPDPDLLINIQTTGEDFSQIYHRSILNRNFDEFSHTKPTDMDWSLLLDFLNKDLIASDLQIAPIMSHLAKNYAEKLNDKNLDPSLQNRYEMLSQTFHTAIALAVAQYIHVNNEIIPSLDSNSLFLHHIMAIYLMRATISLNCEEYILILDTLAAYSQKIMEPNVLPLLQETVQFWVRAAAITKNIELSEGSFKIFKAVLGNDNDLSAPSLRNPFPRHVFFGQNLEAICSFEPDEPDEPDDSPEKIRINNPSNKKRKADHTSTSAFKSILKNSSDKEESKSDSNYSINKSSKK